MMNPFVIAETATSQWSYHLRRCDERGMMLGGGKLVALCGKDLGWDTTIPFAAWGVKDHIPSKWCSECEALAAAEHSGGQTP